MKDLGRLNYFLGLEITHSTDGLYITQAKYASDLLSRAGLTDSKTVDTPVELNAHLTPSREKPLSNSSLYRRLIGSIVYFTVTRPNISYAVQQVASICLLHDQLTMLLFCAFFDTWRALSSMAFSTQLSPLLYFVHSLMLIRQEIPLITGPLQVIAFSLVLLWFLGKVRNKLLWFTPVLKQNIVPLLIPHLISFDYDGFLRIWLCPHPLLLLFIVTTKVPFILFTMMSSMNRLNTSRLIIILSVIILSMVLSSFSPSPPKINLQISSPSHFLRDALMIWLPTSSWSYIHLEFEGGC